MRKMAKKVVALLLAVMLTVAMPMEVFADSVGGGGAANDGSGEYSPYIPDKSDLDKADRFDSDNNGGAGTTTPTPTPGNGTSNSGSGNSGNGSGSAVSGNTGGSTSGSGNTSGSGSSGTSTSGSNGASGGLGKVTTGTSLPTAAKKSKTKYKVLRINCGRKGAPYMSVYDRKSGTTYTKSMILYPGRTYDVKIRFYNWCDSEVHQTIRNLRGQAYVPGSLKKGQQTYIFGALIPANADAKQYSIGIKASQVMKLSLSGRPKLWTNGKVRNKTLSNSLFRWGTGVQLLSSIPGNKKCSGYFTFRIKTTKVKTAAKRTPAKKKPASNW